MNHISKLIPFGLIIAALVGSTSAMAVTRTCSSGMSFDITSGPAKGYTSIDTSNVTGSAGTVFLARKDARRHLDSIFENDWISRNGANVKGLIATLPKGNYTYTTELVITQSDGYGCGGRRTVYGSFTK